MGDCFTKKVALKQRLEAAKGASLVGILGRPVHPKGTNVKPQRLATKARTLVLSCLFFCIVLSTLFLQA